MKYGLNIRYSDQDECYITTCPDFPGLSAFGTTLDEAAREGNMALEMFVEAYHEKGKPLPKAEKIREYSGQFRVRLPKSLHQQLAVRADDEAVSLNTLIIQYVSEGLAEKHKSAKPGRILRYLNDPGKNEEQNK